MSYVPLPASGPYESYEADHALGAASDSSWPGFEIDVLFTPGHSPGHLTFSIPAERAVFSGDVLFQGSVGRTDLPGGDWERCSRSIGTLVESLPEETTVYPGPHGHHDARRGAPHEPVPGRARADLDAPAARASSRPRAEPRRAARRRPRRRRRARAPLRARILGARAASADRDADLRGHRAVRAHGRRGDRHRAEGDVHVRGPGRTLADAAPRGDRAGLPRLPRARHAQASAAGEALVPGPDVPLRARRRRGASASTPRSAPRRSAPTTRRSTPS